MKVFIHTGKGHYIGSTVIVLAKSKKTAEKLIREALNDIGLSNEQLNVRIGCLSTDKPQVIYSYDGDY